MENDFLVHIHIISLYCNFEVGILHTKKEISLVNQTAFFGQENPSKYIRKKAVWFTRLQLELATITSLLVGWSCVLSMEGNKVRTFIKCRVYKLLQNITVSLVYFGLTFMITGCYVTLQQADHFTAAIINS